tara:strand:+ start:323 stop:1093 length:771 start_codon:yes stop_codon:yes gene_type:complete
MINLNGVMSPNNYMDRTYGAIAVGALSAGLNYFQGEKASRDAKAANKEANRLKAIEQQKLDKQKDEYRAMTFENPFSNMENVFEDLTVNQQQANFQARQGNQQRANIMQGLKGAAGSSGIAGLAQSLANQGQIQTQKISASIGIQESANQITSAKGASAVQVAERQGDQWVAQQQADRQATLLGMQMNATTGASLAQQQTQANQMNAQIAQQDNLTSILNVAGQAAGNIDFSGGGGGGGGIPKDTTTTSTASYYTP